MKILNFGSCNIDYVYSLDHIVKAGETEATERLSVFSGGKGLNQSVALAKAGAYVYHAGCVGEDGDILIHELKTNGVDTRYIKSIKEKTGHAIIQVSKDGENSIFLYSGANSRITKEDVDKVLKDFEAGDLLLLQNEINNLEYIIDRAYEKGLKIVLNPSPCSGAILNIDLCKLSYIILNEVEAKIITGKEDPYEALAFFECKYPMLSAILTLGSKGSIYSVGAERFYQPSFLVDAVDTTAAGDTFTGYFLSELVKGKTPEEILRVATCAAAISVSRHGASPSIPLYQEVIEKIACMKERKDVSANGSVGERIDKYITKNFANASLSELAEELGYTTVYTAGVVKKMTGMTFCEALHEKRLAYASTMLTTTDLPIGSIIQKTGYQNENFFRKKFKEKFGVTPLKYRKDKRK